MISGWYRGRRRRRRGAGEDTVPAVGLLVDAHVVGQSAQEVEFGFDPAQDLIGRGEDFEIAEPDFGGSLV